MPILSVIVPVYNEEKRIEQCISSIQNQTFQDLEIIIIDDGSTDRSLEILSRLAQSDRRLKIFSYSNGGTGFALNKGLQKATGKYIGFSGADDWIESDMLEKLISIIETDETDLVVCNILKEFNNTSQKVLHLSKQETLSERLLEKLILMDFDYSICNKLYKRNLLEKMNIQFVEDLRLSQDVLFNLYVFACIKDLSITPAPFYHYVANEGSLMTSPQDKRIESFNYIIRAFRHFCRENHKDQEWKIFEQYIGQGYQKYLFNLILESDHTEAFGFMRYYRHVLRHLKLMDSLLLYAPLDNENKYQRFRKGLLQQKRFKTFSLLAAIRHKTFSH